MRFCSLGSFPPLGDSECLSSASHIPSSCSCQRSRLPSKTLFDCINAHLFPSVHRLGFAFPSVASNIFFSTISVLVSVASLFLEDAHEAVIAAVTRATSRPVRPWEAPGRVHAPAHAPIGERLCLWQDYIYNSLCVLRRDEGQNIEETRGKVFILLEINDTNDEIIKLLSKTHQTLPKVHLQRCHSTDFVQTHTWLLGLSTTKFLLPLSGIQPVYPLWPLTPEVGQVRGCFSFPYTTVSHWRVWLFETADCEAATAASVTLDDRSLQVQRRLSFCRRDAWIQRVVCVCACVRVCILLFCMYTYRYMTHCTYKA